MTRENEIVAVRPLFAWCIVLQLKNNCSRRAILFCNCCCFMGVVLRAFKIISDFVYRTKNVMISFHQQPKISGIEYITLRALSYKDNYIEVVTKYQYAIIFTMVFVTTQPK